MGSLATILLADDNPDDVELLKHAFQKAGLANPVHVVSNGLEVIEYLKGAIDAKSSGYAVPLLISLDIHMPVYSGLEVLSWIKDQPELEEVPVLIVSQSDDGPNINRASHLGANSYLVKPANFNGLVAMMETFKKTLGRLEAQMERKTVA